MYVTRNPRLRFITDPDPGGGDSADKDIDKSTDQEPPEGDDPDDQDGDDPGEDEGDEPFDAARALKKIHKANAEATALRKRARAAEAKAATSNEKDQRITALEAEKLRIRIGYRHGLPDELIDRLQGTTEEEILADAEKLLGAITAGKKPSPTQRPKEALRGGSKPDEEPEETDPRKLAALVPRR